MFRSNKRYLFVGIGLVLFFSILTLRLHDRPLGKFENLIPMYPGAKIQSFMNLEEGSQIVFTTKDSSKKIFNFFKDELIKNGWTVRLERYGECAPSDQTKNADFIALLKENTGLMINAGFAGRDTRATLYIGHTCE